MAKRKRIGVDVDDVLLDFQGRAFEVAESLGVQISEDDMHTWNLDDIVPVEQQDQFWAILSAPGLGLSLKPLPGTQEGIKLLSEVADVYLVTAHLGTAKEWVWERDNLMQQLFGIPRERMVHTKAKYTFSGAALLDDKPENIEDWAADQDGHPILWARNCNARYTFPEEKYGKPVRSRIIRTNSFQHIHDLLRDGAA